MRARRATPRIGALLALAAAVLSLMAAAGTTTAIAGTAHWTILSGSAPTVLPPGQRGLVTNVMVNSGDAPVVATAADPLVVSDELPAGLTPTSKMGGQPGSGAVEEPGGGLHCSPVPETRCTYVGTLLPFSSLALSVPVNVAQSFNGGDNVVKVQGAEAPSQSVAQALHAGEGGTPFGVDSYELIPEEEDGSTDLQAGSHPFQLTTELKFNQTLAVDPLKPELTLPGTPSLLRNLDATLPQGLIGDPLAVPTCSGVAFATLRVGSSNGCPPDTAVGVASVTFKEPSVLYYSTSAVPIYNLEPNPGEPARLGFEFDAVPVTIDTSVLTGGSYAVEADVTNASQSVEVLDTIVTVWGTPGDASHNNARGWECLGEGYYLDALEGRGAKCNPLGDQHPTPYLTLPTTCRQPLSSFVRAQSWQSGAPLLEPVQSPPESLVGCGSLPFTPTINVTPDETTASTPTGMTVEVKLPQTTTLSEGGLAEADVYATELSLPEGLETNAGAADGLETCSVGAVGFNAPESGQGPVLEEDIAGQSFTRELANCPGAAKIGEVTIHTPLLEHDVTGFAYLGGQDTNPFASPLVLYIVAEDPVSGVRVKLAGETRIGPTGQLTSLFKNTPPLPFETLKLHLFGGPRASLSTPARCTGNESKATFFPWSNEEPAVRTSSFTLSGGPNGSPCPSGALPFSPTVVAGAMNDQAAAFSPFTFTIQHPDGNQPLKEITVHLPEGAAAMLSSVTPCPEPQASEDNCGPESEIGVSSASAGFGPDPITLPGKLFLTGPYKGAPFGLLDVTQAKAGPFNLGNVAVRSTINVDPVTAAVTATTDPIPEYVKGVPAQIKELNVTVNRPHFEFNPTNCTPTTVTGTMTGYEEGSASISSPFDVSNCANLPFKPKLTATTAGEASKNNGASFDVTVESPGLGQANIHKVDLTIPEQLPSRTSTIQKACRDTTFEVNPAGCDEGSVIGYAIVHTPVLKNPLTGPAYLVSHGNAAFPDVEFVLQGENGLKVVLDGKTDIKHDVTYSKFETAPDAPFTKFETILPVGPHSALGAYVSAKNPYDLCAAKLMMPTTIVGQNGAVIEQDTHIATTGCKKASTSKAPTRSQRLAVALKLCKKHKGKKSREACAQAARRRYSAVAAKKSSRSHRH